MTKWTKGHWVATSIHGSNNWAVTLKGATEGVAECMNKRAKANAHLIASAPELYEALERTLDWLASYPGDGANRAYEQARAALARALGEAP